MDLYHKRSGQCPLHVGLDDSELLEQLARYAHRIQCLSVPIWQIDHTDSVFPDVTSLRITQYYSPMQLPQITTAHLPALRQLYFTGIFENPLPGRVATGFPPLHTLILSVYRDGELGWLDVIRSCKDSLVSLEISMHDSVSLDEPVTIALNSLQCLNFTIFRSSIDGLPVKFLTPELKTYIQMSQVSVNFCGLLHKDLKSVTHMVADFIPDFSDLPVVETLQLSLSFDRCVKVVRTLTRAGHDCPELKFLELAFFGKARRYPPFEPIVLRQWDREISPNLSIQFYDGNWIREPQGVIEESCGADKPCNVR